MAFSRCLSTSGKHFPGGEDLDERIMNWMADQFLTDNAIDLRQDRLALQRLKEVAERAKCELSSSAETNINLPFIAADATGPKHFNKSLTREKFEELVSDLIEQTVAPCHKALEDAKLQAKDGDKVILVGGQTRSPIVERTVERYLARSRLQRLTGRSSRYGSGHSGRGPNRDKGHSAADVLPLSWVWKRVAACLPKSSSASDDTTAEQPEHLLP